MLLVERIKVVKIAIIPKAIYKFKAVPIKILMVLFLEIKISLKLVWNNKRPPIVKATVKK